MWLKKLKVHVIFNREFLKFFQKNIKFINAKAQGKNPPFEGYQKTFLGLTM